MTRSLRVLIAALAFTLTSIVGAQARADDTIKHPGDHPNYAVELEPHLLLGGYDNLFPGTGFGVGGRFSIPIVQNGFVPSINNSVAITFGLDFLHYGSNCGYLTTNYSCSANYLYFPVAMQWNYFVAQKWSVFGEPGLFIFHGFYDQYCPPNPNGVCYDPGSQTGVRPAFYLGGRYHFNEKVSLTMRIGYPTISVGVSWFL